MNRASLIEALPGDFYLTLVDVGSAGGLHRRWNPYRSILSSVLFDPREPAAIGSFGRGATKVYPVALGDKDGEAELFLTGLPNMSSFLRPDPTVFARYGKKEADAAITSTETVPLVRLDELARRDGFAVHALKVDTQGSELMVLNGAAQALKSTLLAEVEVSFFQRYVDQPRFADIEAFMVGQGFDLIDLLQLKRYRADNSLGLRNAAVPEGEKSGRVAYGNAIFLRREEHILSGSNADGGLGLLRSIVALVAYGKADIAAQLLDRCGDSLGLEQATKMQRALRSLPISDRKPNLIRRLLGKPR